MAATDIPEKARDLLEHPPFASLAAIRGTPGRRYDRRPGRAKTRPGR